MIRSRVTLFFILPFCVGSFAFVLSYINKKVLEDGKAGELNFDTDFIIPFLLSFVVVSVVMVQTKGFSSKAKPIVSWPKVRKKRKVVRKTVVVDDDGNIIEDENVLKKLDQRKKKN